MRMWDMWKVCLQTFRNKRICSKRMRNFQGIVFIWTQKYREIFKSALVYFSYATIECIEINWLCKNRKKVSSSQASTSRSYCTELGKTVFLISII